MEVSAPCSSKKLVPKKMKTRTLQVNALSSLTITWHKCRLVKVETSRAQVVLSRVTIVKMLTTPSPSISIDSTPES
jgi:hypothetical protein